MTRPTAFFVACMAGLAAVLSGCSSVPWAPVPLDATTGFYKTAALTYRLDAGALQQPLDVLLVEHQQVSYEQVASSPQPEVTVGTLTVTYPHPAGRSGMAQARFTIQNGQPKSTTAAWIPFGRQTPDPAKPIEIGVQPELHESWVLDIPSAESDQLFKMLANQGFYQTNRLSSVGVKLSATIDGREVHKDWEQVPALDALIQRVRRDGQLVAYHRSSNTAGGARPAVASTKAYADMLAHMGAPVLPTAPTGTPAGSPFAMPGPAFQGPYRQSTPAVANVPHTVR